MNAPRRLAQATPASDRADGQKTIHLVAAARPNFMKIAPLWHALSRTGWARPVFVHTGQHYDERLAGGICRELGLPAPEIALGIGSGTHAEQTGGVLIAYAKVLAAVRPDLVVVVGDVNATPGAALAAVKLGIPVAHLESGLRSGDRSMPEEINRIITDAMVDYHWTPSPDADEALLREGVPAGRIARIGNIMIDTLVMMRPAIDADPIRDTLRVADVPYAVATLHRPATVDDPDALAAACGVLLELGAEARIVFPVHPRTRARLEAAGLLGRLKASGRVILADALPYCAFMRLVTGARFILTDSGGVQEETTFLGIPCVTLRDTTERPLTVTEGTNILARPDTIHQALAEVHARPHRPAPALWDGKTAERAVAEIRRILGA